LIDKDFYKSSGPFTLFELARFLKCDYIGNKKKKIFDISTLDLAKDDELSFFSNNKYRKSFEKTKAGVLIINKKFLKDNKNCLITDNPHYAMAQVASLMYPNSDYPNFYFMKNEQKKNIDKSIKFSFNSFIHHSSNIGKKCNIGSNVVIGPGVKIGTNCIIGDNVSIYFSKVSDNVKIYQGVKIGGEGFGFTIQKDSFKKIPQLGRVIIQKNVEIGCNSTIDRGSIGDTVIGKGTMIDNMVHIGHNVIIGNRCIIAAMTGISGSARIGDNTMIGGQVGISGHINIGSNVKIAAKSGVMRDISDNTSVGGFPAENILDWHRGTILLKKKLKNEKRN
jgi:UDP-3-O-[3-hydroxymyristoyl] glucosamine N-acyltransferase